MTAFDTVRGVGETAGMPNRLATATSPYLLQHADNPVDWYEWGPEALARAASEQKPIFLSIGYAACHWCHVMERESFEDHETAAFMNDHFVCIKVDREERPDLDAIYMDAVQAMTGHGGWPMTMFCTPDGLPFYGGTYFPPDDRHGLPSFRRVLMGVAEAWRSQRDQAIEQGGTLLSHIMQRSEGTAGGNTAIDASLLRAAFDAMRAGFDDEWGGFGGAPKFPQPMALEFLMRCVRMGFAGAATMLATTLSKMARGGVYDQIGGGFHRYAVDRIWLVPHFEKMLYDNGQLLRLYARAAVVPALAADHGLFRAVAIETGEYLLREMRHPSGGFFSSQDADADGVEGKFHVWSYDQFMRVAGDDAAAASAFYGVTPDGNWEGSTVLWIPRDPADVAADLGTSVDAMHAAVERARTALLAARSARTKPATDDKILAAWNGLAISGLAEAGRLLDRSDFVDAAVAAADFVMSALRREDGRLLRSWRDGRTSGPGYLDDYALMGGALLDVYETTFEERHADAALELARDMRTLFADDAGGFYDTGSDAEALVLRPRDVFDNAVPSGNAAAANLLLRLSALTGDGDFDDAARATLARIAPITARAPLAFGEALTAMDAVASGIKEVAIAGDPGAPATRSLARQVWLRPWVPRVLAVAQPGESALPLMAHRSTRDGAPAAYVCEHFTCKEPVTTPDELAHQLDG